MKNSSARQQSEVSFPIKKARPSIRVIENSKYNLIRDTLESSFNKTQFVNLIKNLLNEFEEKAFIYRGNTIPKSIQSLTNYEMLKSICSDS